MTGLASRTMFTSSFVRLVVGHFATKSLFTHYTVVDASAASASGLGSKTGSWRPLVQWLPVTSIIAGAAVL